MSHQLSLSTLIQLITFVPISIAANLKPNCFQKSLSFTTFFSSKFDAKYYQTRITRRPPISFFNLNRIQCSNKRHRSSVTSISKLVTQSKKNNYLHILSQCYPRDILLIHLLSLKNSFCETLTGRLLQYHCFSSLNLDFSSSDSINVNNSSTLITAYQLRHVKFFITKLAQICKLKGQID